MTNHPHRSKSSVVPAHTPTPWEQAGLYLRSTYHPMIPDHGGWLLADLSASPVDERRANAAFIVRAVNAHDALVAALAYFVEYAGDGANFVEDDVAEIAVTRKAMDDARAALALAAAEGVANG